MAEQTVEMAEQTVEMAEQTVVGFLDWGGAGEPL
jgi:hypothetical protein